VGSLYADDLTRSLRQMSKVKQEVVGNLPAGHLFQILDESEVRDDTRNRISEINTYY
jgi:hypothetical protein